MIYKTYQSIVFYLSFKNKNTRIQLKKLSENQRASCEIGCFYYFQLGMFISVVKNTYKGNGWRGNFAKAVALAGTGDFEKAEQQVYFLCNELKANKFCKLKLAISIAPYLPFVALELINNNTNLTAKKLKLALLLSTGQEKKANQALKDLDSKDHITGWYLLNFTETSEKRLELLNNQLRVFDLEPVCLLDNQKNLSPYNIYSCVKDINISGPLVSILVTTYNSEEFVETALTSLLNQTYQNIEIVVIDDASSDSTVDIIQSVIKRDSRVRFIAMPINNGTFYAKTQGLKLTRGEFVTCHDSDDWAHPRKIEFQVKPLLKNPDLIYTTSKWIRMDMVGKLYSRNIYPLLRLNPASPLFRKDIVLEVMGSWDLVKTGSDSEFIARLNTVFGSNSSYSVREPLTIGAHREGSLMTDKNTGYNAQGISLERIRYWEYWNHKLIQLSALDNKAGE